MTDETAKPADAEIPVEVEDEEAKAEPQQPQPEQAAAEPSAEDRLATLEKEKKELHDRLLRSAADFDNYRKRSRKDVEEARAKGREEVLREMLGVVDNLERALAAAGGSDAAGAIVQGVQLVLKQFASALERFDVKAFASVGEGFDPTRHEAIAQVESADKPAGTVVVEMQKGYMMGARLLRPAMVGVARPPAAPPPPEPPAAAEAAPEAAPEVAAEPAPATGAVDEPDVDKATD